jgi:hypothetical protein
MIAISVPFPEFSLRAACGRRGSIVNAAGGLEHDHA